MGIKLKNYGTLLKNIPANVGLHDTSIHSLRRHHLKYLYTTGQCKHVIKFMIHIQYLYSILIPISWKLSFLQKQKARSPFRFIPIKSYGWLTWLSGRTLSVTMMTLCLNKRTDLIEYTLSPCFVISTQVHVSYTLCKPLLPCIYSVLQPASASR